MDGATLLLGDSLGPLLGLAVGENDGFIVGLDVGDCVTQVPKLVLSNSPKAPPEATTFPSYVTV